MKAKTTRMILRWIHVLFAIPIVGYIYSPFEALPDYAHVVRYIAVPAIVVSGLWMWLGRGARQANPTSAQETSATP